MRRGFEIGPSEDTKHENKNSAEGNVNNNIARQIVVTSQAGKVTKRYKAQASLRVGGLLGEQQEQK